jgi:hypothetical protein
MLVDVTAVAVFLIIGNIAFRHFDPFLTLTQRILKIAAILAITALVSYFFGRAGVMVAFVLAVLPVIYIHGIWLPRRGVNGWTGEPKERYYELRGWKEKGKDLADLPRKNIFTAKTQK